MRLVRLDLESFRSYRSAELQPAPGLTIVAGPNGAGKTNLLEAVQVAITGRSPRAAADVELVHHGAFFARIRLDLIDERGSELRIEALIPGVDAPREVRKRVTLNGLPRRVGGLGETVRSVLFRPEEMLLLVGSPSERRRFLDAIVAQRDRAAVRDLAELARVLAQRNALLRAIRHEEAGEEELAFWDEQLAMIGARVMAQRLAIVGQLGELIGPLHDAVAPASERGERVRLAYADSLKDAWPARATGVSDALEDRELLAARLAVAYRERLAGVRQKELWNGVSLVGPQRDDLSVELDGREVATHASRGQQRTIILAMKLAETDLLSADGPAPVVLLDDVFSELDPQRSERALELLLERGQVLVTMADLSSLPARRRRSVPIWQVSDGSLQLTPRVA
ncbi:MAG: DNA replication and repair protein RecF [Chloroflexi bacterium]|nr:MAG: DNA replication and repair protein RecF [Chloroflexota bacterium]